MNDAMRILESFVRQWGVLLTTYKRGGTPVGTAVNIVVEGDHAYFRTWDTAWKFRCIRNNPAVEFAPCTPLGRPMGPAIRAHARVLKGKESAQVGRLLASKYPVSHGILAPLVHRLRGNRTVHIELKHVENTPGPWLTNKFALPGASHVPQGPAAEAASESGVRPE